MRNIGLLMAVVACASFYGCKTPPPVVSDEPDGGLVARLGDCGPEVPFFRLKLADDNFRFTIDRAGIPKLETLSDKATLEDLMDFVRTVCWNSKVQPKLDAVEPITIDDAVLINFVLDAEVAFVHTVSLAIHDDILGRKTVLDRAQLSEDVKVEEYRERETDFLKPLMDRYLNSNGRLRASIRAFGSNFDRMDSDDKESVLGSIYRGDFAEDVRGESLKAPWYWPYTTTGQNKTKSDIERSSATIAYGNKISSEWRSVRKLAIPYLHEVWRNYGMLEKYYTSDKLTDSASRKMARIVYQESQGLRDLMLENFCYQLYDFPFAILTHRGAAEYRDCKGFWNDDEEEMAKAAVRYGESISGAEMLSHVESRYAVSVYADFIESLKDDLGDTLFYKVAHEARLQEFAGRQNEKDARTGLSVNSTKEF